MNWLTLNWLRLTFIVLPLLIIFPLVTSGWSPPVLLIYLASPAYMLHQIEEHSKDRFRKFVNQKVFGGVEALSPMAIFWINVPIVWGVNLFAFVCVTLGYGGLSLIAIYTMLINAISHIIVIFRFAYNPGLITSIFLFLPLSVAAFFLIESDVLSHLIALTSAIVGHALILANASIHARRSIKSGIG